MAYSVGDSPDTQTPLYIFYGCRTTDKDLRVDKIIEIAGIICMTQLSSKSKKELKSSKSHEFSSLCFSDRELGPSMQKLTGLTKEDLKDERPLDEVLINFFEWIDCSVSKASEIDDEDYTPVLVVHSGNAMDFFMLLKEIDTYPLLIRQFKRLNLHYLDTYYVFQELKNDASYEDELASLSIQRIYKAFFRNTFDDSKAIKSAKALYKVFTDGPLAAEGELLKKYTHTRKEMEAWEEEVKKFREAWIRPSKAKLILSKGITYDIMVKEYKKSPKDFRLFLKKKCGILNARPELIYHFRTSAMAYGIGSQLGKKRPLYFFYDCETTGLDVEGDKIIEVAAIIHLASLKPATQRELKENGSHEFSSLCSCDRELGEVPQRLTGLTRDRLRDEPPLEDVLKRFFEWVKVSIATANRLDQEEYTPVLVAHSGNCLDFPILITEVDKSPSLQRKFRSLDVRYVDTFNVLVDLKRRNKLDVDSLSMRNIYKAFFHMPYEGHRALPDARALCKIFTETKLAREMELFLKFIQNQKEMMAMEEQVKKFRRASFGVHKACELLVQGITYEVMVREFKKSPQTFKTFLKSTCMISYVKPEQIEHFTYLY